MDTFYATVEPDNQKKNTVKIATLSSDNAEVSSILMNGVDINGKAINAVLEGGAVVVNTLELDSVVREVFFSRAHVERELDVNIKAAARLKSGEAVSLSGTSKVKLTPIATPKVAAGGYCLLGDLVENGGGWDVANPVMMKAVAGKEGIYQVTIETKNEGSNWYKFYEAYDTAGGWDAANAGEIGCRVNGDDKSENFAVWKGDVYQVQTPTITGKGHFVVTFDAINFTYTVTPATAYLYMAGDANGWKQLDVMASPKFDNVYKGYMYLNQNGFKFCTEEGWGGTNYGADFSTAGDAANITMSEAPGFYQVIVDLNKKEYKLTPVAIGIIGNATAGGWDSDTDMTYDVEKRCWTITTDLAEGELKFRANDDWAINWGGALDNLTEGGGNIKVAAGKYTIKFYPLCEGKSHCTIEAAE